MRSDELHAELEQLADEIEPFTPNALAVHRRVRRRRVVIRSSAAVLALIVAAGVAVSVRDGGRKRVEVISTPKLELNLASFGRVDYLLFPEDTAAAQQLLENTPLVTKYALLPAGPRAPIENGLMTAGFTPAACRLRDESGLAVQIDDNNPAATRTQDWFGDESRIADVSPHRHVDAEIFMDVTATPADTQAVAAALAKDDELAAPAQFIDHATAYRNFKEDFADQPALVESTTADVLPASFQLHLQDELAADRLIARYNLLPGVDTGVDNNANREGFFSMLLPTDPDAPDAEIFMNIDATAAQIAKVSDRLKGRADVEEFRFLNHEDAFEEFKRDFADQPELLGSTTADLLPESFRVNAKRDDQVDSIERDFATMAGVDTVITSQVHGPDDTCP